MDIIQAYENAPELGYIRGQQSAGSYTAVVSRQVYNPNKIDTSPLQVGEDAIVMVEDISGNRIFIIGKVVSVEADTDVKVGVYVQGGDMIYAPSTVIARFVPQTSFVMKETPSGIKVEVVTFKTVLNAGTVIKRMTWEFIESFIDMFSDRKVFTPGTFLGSSVPIPFWLPHFGTEDKNGIGEAYHIGIFGRTGSGKSALAKILMAYYAVHRPMSIIVLDPQGEFYRDLSGKGGSGTYPLDVVHYWKATGGSVILAPIYKIAFEDRDDIESLLMAVITKITRFIGITMEVKKARLVDIVLPIFHGFALYISGKEHKVPPSIAAEFREVFGDGDLSSLLNDVFKDGEDSVVLDDIAKLVLDRIDRRMDDIYDRESTREEKRKNILRLKDDPERYIEFKRALLHILKLISGERTINDLINRTVDTHTMLVLSMSSSGDIDEFLQYFLIDTFLRKLVSIASSRFKQGKQMNTMVFLDEAHRFVPSGRQDDEYVESLRRRLITAVRETRKYGLGWTFISQTLGSLSSEVVYQIRIFLIGYGLVMASERAKVRELVSGYPGAMDVYMSFPDPFSSKFFGRSFFPFMGVGPVSPLSATGAPLFFASYDASSVRRSLDKLIPHERSF